MPVLAVAALIVSVLALVAAAFSAWYARDVARTERDRRLEECAPKITPRLRRLPDPGPPWVLELRSSTSGKAEYLGRGRRQGGAAAGVHPSLADGFIAGKCRKRAVSR
jgi:hypothetical protein